MAAVSAVMFLAFSVVTNAWSRGLQLTDELHHGDFVMEQLVMGLRSAYYPDTGGRSPAYGFRMEDHGDGEYASDMISWVKMGGALIGSDHRLAGSLHRVSFSIDDGPDFEDAVTIDVIRLETKPDTLDEQRAPDRLYISKRVTGFNCRTAFEKDEDEEIDWLDEWEETNRLPRYVEVTLYLAPLADDEPPVELKRAFKIPTAHLSWR